MSPRWRRAVVAGAVAAALLAALAGAARAHTPPCAIDERIVAVDPDVHPDRVLLDPTWRLPPGYAPGDLVPLSDAGFAGDLRVRTVVIDDLRALREAAEADGVRLAVQSAYRSEAYQAQVHAGWVRLLGAARAAEVSARPGHSEHQLGTAVDLRSADGPPAWDLPDWAATPEGTWVAEHAPRFGFVVSYPRDAQHLSCYDHEPWHLRWVGREAATAARASGLAYRAWLHLHHPPAEAP